MLKTTYDLRLGDKEYKEDCLKLLKAFFDESPYNSSKFSKSKVSSMYDGLIKDKTNALVLVAVYDNKPIGILVGNISEMLFSNEVVASELCWFVLPEHRKSRIGLKMFDAFEYWAKEKQGAKHIVMVHLENESSNKLTQLYNKKGYEKKEQAYMRTI